VDRADQTARFEAERVSLDGYDVVRLDGPYNEIMRQVASSTGATFVDGATLLESHNASFVDICHFGADGHRLLGARLAEEIAKWATP
jgi:hypothetical protein